MTFEFSPYRHSWMSKSRGSTVTFVIKFVRIPESVMSCQNSGVYQRPHISYHQNHWGCPLLPPGCYLTSPLLCVKCKIVFNLISVTRLLSTLYVLYFLYYQNVPADNIAIIFNSKEI